jgi:hypothetical protein
VELVVLMIGIPVGIIQSIFSWWIVLRFLAPKLEWSSPSIVILSKDLQEDEELVFRLHNRGRRPAVDVQLLAELRVDHQPLADDSTRTVLRLPLNTPWYPAIRNDARVRISARDISDEDWGRLSARTGVEGSGLRFALSTHPGAHVRLTALASDQLAGGRLVFQRSDLRLRDFDLVARMLSDRNGEESTQSIE